MKNYNIKTKLTIILLSLITYSAAANEFDKFLKPLFDKKCSECHGKKKTKGKVNLFEIKTFEEFKTKGKLIKEVIEAVDANDMPPEDEAQLSKSEKEKLLITLKKILQDSADREKVKEVAYRRLNRFQYNNTVKDLFKLRKDIFGLPEKLMIRRSNYLFKNTGSMPEKVNVFNIPHQDERFKGVEPFPQDLRAMHGFDNQADQLNLPPVLLDSFLKLSLSIVNSPDFNEQSCGIWDEFFKEPAKGANTHKEIKSRLKPFLSRAFRTVIDEETLEQYSNYTLLKIKAGMSFTEAMKKVASATLCSPRFLLRVNSNSKNNYELASKLSYFLWGSGPDPQLISKANSGKLQQKEILTEEIDRMLKDPKIERFLDTFPTQWMQLENIKSAVPDKKLYRTYSLDKRSNPGMHMAMEPLLLFDAVFIENRPLQELLTPKFTYRNEFLNKWYSQNDKEPSPEQKALEDKKLIAKVTKLRQETSSKLNAAEKELHKLTSPIVAKLKKPEKNPKKKKKGLYEGLSPKQISKHLSKDENKRRVELEKIIRESQIILKENPELRNEKTIKAYKTKLFDKSLVQSLNSYIYQRVPVKDTRYGGIITNAAVMTMTSAPKRTQPIARGAWMIEVIFNDPPPPPPNDIPPLDEENVDHSLTIKEKFEEHRKNPDCAGCHNRLDPLGFALENYDVVGLWRDEYSNKRKVDPGGKMMKKYEFQNVLDFKQIILKEKKRFARAFTGHLLRFALSRKLTPSESIVIDNIVAKTEKEDFKIKSIIREVILSESFLGKGKIN